MMDFRKGNKKKKAPREQTETTPIDHIYFPIEHKKGQKSINVFIII